MTSSLPVSVPDEKNAYLNTLRVAHPTACNRSHENYGLTLVDATDIHHWGHGPNKDAALSDAQDKAWRYHLQTIADDLALTQMHDFIAGILALIRELVPPTGYQFDHHHVRPRTQDIQISLFDPMGPLFGQRYHDLLFKAGDGLDNARQHITDILPDLASQHARPLALKRLNGFRERLLSIWQERPLITPAQANIGDILANDDQRNLRLPLSRKRDSPRRKNLWIANVTRHNELHAEIDNNRRTKSSQ